MKKQKIKNAELRLAIRKGELPYTFIDSQEKTYRQIVYKLGQEMNKKFSVTKVGDKWTIDIA
jgi:hypothetical protein